MKPSALAVLLLLASPALAQQKEDPLKDIKYGMRVEIMLRSGFGVYGKIVPETPEDTDLSKAKTILLDMSLEYPELGGRRAAESGKLLPNLVGFERILVKSVRRLPDLTKEEVAGREKAREAELARILADEANRRQREAEYEADRKRELEERIKTKRADEAKTVEGKAKLALEQIEKSRSVYEKYAPKDGWGEDKMKEFEGKMLRKQPLTPEEKEFHTNYADWVFYKNYLEGKGKVETDLPKEEKEEKKEEPKSNP